MPQDTSTHTPVALLAASGCDETHMTAVQKALTRAQIPYVLVAPEPGLLNTWHGTSWGHYFMVDHAMGKVLGSDLDALIVLGGERGVAKLRANPHTRRLVNHFLEAQKPLALVADAVGLLTLSTASAGRCVAASSDAAPMLEQGGLVPRTDDLMEDGVLVTSTGADLESWADSFVGCLRRTAEALSEAA